MSKQTTIKTQALKHPIRIGMLEYVSELVSYLEHTTCTIIEIDDVKTLLKDLAKTQIKSVPKDMQPHLTKILSKLQRDIINIAKTLDDTRYKEDLDFMEAFDKNKLQYRLFDGQLLGFDQTNTKSYDAVSIKANNKTIAHVFGAVATDVVDTAQIELQAERDFGKKCVGVIRHYDLPSTISTVTVKDNSKPKNGKYKNKKKPTQKDNHKIIGKIKFSNQSKFSLEQDQGKDQIFGYIFEEYADTVVPNDIIVIESVDDG